MTKRNTVWVFLIVLSILFISGCALKPENAQEELKKQNITYDANGFLKAIEDDNINAVKLFLKGGMSPSVRGENGRTPLHSAANFGRDKIAELLIEKGADVNAQNEKGATPFFLAVYTGHKDMVKLLASKGADVNIKTKDGIAPLSLAIKQYDPELIKVFVEHNADVTLKREDGSTILHDACGSSMMPLEIIKLLISGGAKPDVKNKAGLTPLEAAKKANNKEIVDYLSGLSSKTDKKDTQKK